MCIFEDAENGLSLRSQHFKIMHGLMIFQDYLGEVQSGL